MKYKLIRLRCKISYLAFSNDMLITEFLHQKILDSYTLFLNNGEFECTNMDKYA